MNTFLIICTAGLLSSFLFAIKEPLSFGGWYMKFGESLEWPITFIGFWIFVIALVFSISAGWIGVIVLAIVVGIGQIARKLQGPIYRYAEKWIERDEEGNPIL